MHARGAGAKTRANGWPSWHDAEPAGSDRSAVPQMSPRQKRFFEIFTQALVAEDIAEPLPSFDGIQQAGAGGQSGPTNATPPGDWFGASGHIEGYALRDLTHGLYLAHLRHFPIASCWIAGHRFRPKPCGADPP